MNSKTCKVMRRMAEKATIGAPARSYHETTKAKPVIGGHNPDGSPWYWTPRNTLALDVSSTRGAYRALKKKYRRAAHNLAQRGVPV